MASSGMACLPTGFAQTVLPGADGAQLATRARQRYKRAFADGGWRLRDYYEYLFQIAGWSSAALSIYAFNAKTMIPLRVAALSACALGLIWGLSRGNYPNVVANAALLPLNLARLAQMRRLIVDSKAASERPSGYEWLKPFMHPVEFAAGQTMFGKGDVGSEAFLVGSGEVSIPEHGAKVGPGALLGEIGLLTSGNRRTASAICLSDVRAWRVSFGELEQLCLQNPEFCLHMARIIVRRYEANLVAGSSAA
jgi:CRP/FNR family transcriptional regulator, cyclic AMP receptor protein